MEFLRRHEQAKHSVLHVDERIIFLPFRNTQELQPVDLDKAYRKDEMPLMLKQEIEFKGIKGAVNICTDPQPQEEDSLTPLGDVRLTTTYSDGSEHITEAPCFIEIEFEARTQEQFDILEDYQAQVFLNDDVYYLNCAGFVNSQYAFQELKKHKHVFVQNGDLRDKDDQKVSVLLPQNATALSAIRMRIIDYDDDKNDNEELVTAPSPTPDALTIS